MEEARLINMPWDVVVQSEGAGTLQCYTSEATVQVVAGKSLFRYKLISTFLPLFSQVLLAF
jgi:hypothetical protein